MTLRFAPHLPRQPRGESRLGEGDLRGSSIVLFALDPELVVIRHDDGWITFDSALFGEECVASIDVYNDGYRAAMTDIRLGQTLFDKEKALGYGKIHHAAALAVHEESQRQHEEWEARKGWTQEEWAAFRAKEDYEKQQKESAASSRNNYSRRRDDDGDDAWRGNGDRAAIHAKDGQRQAERRRDAGVQRPRSQEANLPHDRASRPGDFAGSIQLRDYQSRAIRELAEAIRSGCRRILLVGPTGMGKMVVAAYLMQRMEHKGNASMFIADQRELVDQCYRKLKEHGVDTNIIMSQMDSSIEGAMAYLASKDTLHARAIRTDKIEMPSVRSIINDEAHKSLADTWQKVLRYYTERGVISIGLTATPVRADGRGLGENYDKLIQVATYEELRNGGWIVPSIVYAPTQPDLRGVQVARGDYVRAQLEGKMNTQKLVGDVVLDWQRRAAGRLTFCFASGVQHSIHLRNEFRRHGISAEHIDSKHFTIAQRDEIMGKFKRGEITVLCNFGICLDADTEILTNHGWRRYDGLKSTDLIASYASGGAVEFVRPQSVTIRDRKSGERMVAMKGQRCDVRVTEDHDIVVLAGAGRRALKKRKALDSVGVPLSVPVSGMARPATFSMVDRRPPIETSHRVYSHAYSIRKRTGVDSKASLAMAREYGRRRAAARPTPPSDLSLDDCRFIGFWLGDGSKSKARDGGMRYSACQGEAYPKIIDWFNGVLSGAGIHSTTTTATNKTGFTTGGSRLVRWHFSLHGPGGVGRLDPYLNKQGTDLFRCLSESQFAALVEGLWMADGDHGDGSEPRGTMRICGAVKPLLDVIQSVAVCRGYRADMQETDGNIRRAPGSLMMWRLSLQKTDRKNYRKSFYEIEPGWKAEKVWCVSVPSGMIITRRNGKVAILGNCTTGVDVPEASCVISARPTKSFSLWRQMCGRGLRRADGKRDLIVLDHSGAVFRHGFPDEDVEWTLNAEEQGYKRKKTPNDGKPCPQCGTKFKGLKCPGCGYEVPPDKPYKCPDCDRTYRGPECPGCGRKKALREKSVKMEKGELSKVDREKMKAKLNEAQSFEQKEKEWKKFVGVCIQKGWKMSRAVAMYKSKYGVFPRPNFDLMPKGKSQQDMLAREFYQLYQDNKVLGKKGQR